MGPLSAINGSNAGRIQAATPVQGQGSPAPPTQQSGPSVPVGNTSSVQAITRDRIESVANALEQYIQTSQRDLHIQVHQGTGRVMVQVIARSDGKVIREIPPEELLNLAARIDEMVGLLFSRNA